MLISKQRNTCESLSGAKALRSMKNMMMMLMLKKTMTVPLCLAAWTPPSPSAAQGLLTQVRLLTHTPVCVFVCVPTAAQGRLRQVKLLTHTQVCVCVCTPTVAQGLLSPCTLLTHIPVYHVLPISAWQTAAHDNAGSASSSPPSRREHAYTVVSPSQRFVGKADEVLNLHIIAIIPQRVSGSLHHA